MRIVVVEGNISVAKGLRYYLQDAGHAVDLLHDGCAADALLRSDDADIVVLDIDLPMLDGLTGLVTYTVWQPTDVRDGFVRTRTVPVFAALSSMIGALGLIVWFGGRRGLASLL